MTGMKKKLASLLLMLTLIMCQMPALVFANDMPADVPPAGQQEQTSGQDDQNDKSDQNGQPADNQENIANAGGNEEGTDGQNGDEVSKEQTTGSDASGTDETNGGDNNDLSDDVDDVNKTDVPAQENGMRTLSGESKDGDKETNLTVKSASFYAVVLEGGSVSVENPNNSKIESINAGKYANLLDDTWLGFNPGETAKMTATPAGGYEFGGWYKNWNESSRQLYSSAATIKYALPESGSDSLTAYFKPASVTSISKVTAYIINPETGRTAAQTIPSNCVSFPPYYNTHCMVNAASAGFVTDATGSQAYTGNFESGKTYYLKFTIDANDGYIFSDSVEKEIHTATLVNTSLSEDKKHLTLTVSFTPKDVTGNLLDKVDLKLTPPEEGKKATDVSATSAIAKTGNNDIQISKAAWVRFDPSEPKYEGNAPFTGTFAKGNTYYLEVRLVDGTNDKLAARAGGNSFDTEITVSEGGSKAIQGGGAFAEASATYIFQSAVISFTPGKSHTVTFDAQGGTPVPDTQKIAHGGHATKPADPSKNGFYMLGWFTKTPDKLTREDVYANTPPGFNFANTAINEDTQLHAAWYAGFYGATYDLSAATPKYAETGGRVTFTSVYQQKTDATRVWWNYSNIQGSQVTVTAIPEQGAHFVGWAPATLDSQGNMPDTPPSRNTIVSTESTYTFTFNGKTALAALFERNNVTIKFDTHGATTDTPADQVILKGGKATAPSTPTKSPFTFAGWYDNANHTGSPVNFSTATFNKDTTLHAAWKKTLLIHVFDKTTKSKTKGGKVKIDGGSPSTFISQQLFEGDSATITAEADTGYRFVGWSTSSDNPAGNIISTEKSYVINNYDGLSQLWAVFEEKPPVLTLHASSIEGDDFVEPIKIEVAKGTTISQALEQYKSGTSLDTELFKRDGYKDSKFRTNKPITNYTSEEGLYGDSVSGDTAINADKDIYYIMYKEIDKVSAGIESPVCGTETSNKSDSAPYDQTNAPAVSVNAGNGYKLFTADSRPYAFWTENGTEMGPFAGNFKGDSTYYAKFKLLADFGYVFSALPTANLDNAEVTLVQVEDAVRPTNLMVGGAVKAVHDWGEWKVVKEPTETENGLAERRCKVIDCGAYEEEIIPKLTVEYSFTSGDGSTWMRGTADKLNFVVKRSRADETAIDHFKGLKVDGKEVPSSGYAAKAGSVVIDLMPAYLGTLADGDHTLTAVFDDGNKETSASFKVLSAADKGSKDKANSNKKGSPATGDEAQLLIWLMILCTAGLALSDRIIRRLKNDSADR